MEQQWPADVVERWPLAALVANARNARTHSEAQVEQIAASIREWGWTMPVLVDEEGTLIAGHGRVLAAARLGLDSVPAMVARGWTEEQRRAYLIADNKLALNASWDESLLKIEVEDLKALGFEVPLIGFTDEELAKIATFGQAPENFAEVDESIETEHQCPRCGYVWSGSSKVAKEQDDGEAA